MTRAKYQLCTRCVMDTSDPEISFDSQGRCNHCTACIRRNEMRARLGDVRHQMQASIDRMKAAGKGSDYDCVVGISGGADSTYCAYMAVRHGLRVLAVHMDNGWNSAIASRNIKKLVERLSLPYVSFVLDWEEFKDLQLAFMRASVPEIETPTDIAIPAVLHRVAAENNVRHIIAGGNLWTEGILPRAWHYDAKDLKYLKAIHRKFGSRPLRSFPTFGYQQETYYKLIKGIRFVYLLEHVDYNSNAVTALLEEEVGWQPPPGKHHESTITRFVQSYILPVKFNMDYRRATYSSRICIGELTREWALEQLKKLPYDPAQLDLDKHFIAKKFGITRATLEEILALPAKSHRDYPNDKAFLEGLYGAYAKFLSPRRPLEDEVAPKETRPIAEPGASDSAS